MPSGHQSPSSATARDKRDAAVAAVLARAARAGEVEPSDALRIIKHEMRRRNTNKKLEIRQRSVRAQEVIDTYAARGERPPNNNSLEALHADHVYPIRKADLYEVTTVHEWLIKLRGFREVVCVTAQENYTLEAIERSGVHGPEKYALAGIAWAPAAASFVIEATEVDSEVSA